MTLYTNSFEGGTNGAVVNTGNSGGANGTAFAGASATNYYDNTVSMHGSQSMKCVAAAAASYVRFPDVTGTTLSLRYYFYMTAAQDFYLTQVKNTSVVTMFTIRSLPTGKLRIMDSAAATLHDMPNTFPLSTWCRVELVFTVGTTATTGTINFAVYAGDSTTALDSWSTNAANLTTATVGQVQMGVVSTSTATVYLDDLALDTTGTAFLGPSVTITTTSATYTGAVTLTNFTATGGAAQAVLSDANDTTFVTSADNPTGALIDGTLGPLAKPTADFTVQVRAQKTNAASGTLTATLYEGATQRAQVTGLAIPDVLSTLNVTFPAASLSAVSTAAWASGLRLVLSATAS